MQLRRDVLTRTSHSEMSGNTSCMSSMKRTLLPLLSVVTVTGMILVYLNTSPLNTIFPRQTPCVMDKIGKLFVPIVNETDQEGLRKAMEAFDNAVRDNVTYMMYAGTLLGSYRHHGFIPWDKDIDLLVDDGKKDILEAILVTLKPEFELTKMGRVWRFCHVSATPTDSGWRWPYMDIFFYKENDTHIWATFGSEVDIKYDKNNTFPLIERPFMGLMLPAPRHSKTILEQKFDISLCKSNIYAFKDDLYWKPVVGIPCSFLEDSLPFVKRGPKINDSHIYEKLQLGGKPYGTHDAYILPR